MRSELKRQKVQEDSIGNLLLSALAGIEPQYFEVPIKDSKLQKALERAYAYELYHRLRSSKIVWAAKLRIVPELPKNYLELVNAVGTGMIPDLLIFEPGNHHLAIEIKPAKSIRCLPRTSLLAGGQTGIPITAKDIATLRTLKEALNYSCVVLLIYGSKGGIFPHRQWHQEQLANNPWLTILWHQTQNRITDVATGEVLIKWP